MWPLLISLIGTGSQAVGSSFGANLALKQSRYQKDIFKYQADYERAANEINVERVKRGVGQVKSAQRAATAASGFQSSDAAELEMDTEIQGEIDIAILRTAGGIENLRLQTAGRMARATGYGQAAGLQQRAQGSLLNTTMSIGERQGWFAPASSSGTKIPYIPAS